MNKSCSSCRSSFEVTDTDRAFYDKVSPVIAGKKYAIPVPTLCPDCRNQRRMVYRNDRTFYHRKCDLTGKQIISIYPSNSPYTVYHQDEWYSDKWDPMDYARDYDFSRSFFKQYNDLMHAVPRLGVDIINCENSDYCNYCGDDKNCYLDIAGEANEDCYFNLFTKYSKNVVDSTFVYKSELCYECIQCYDSYNLLYCRYCDNCNDCLFSFDLKGCKDCLFCYGLRNKQYCVLNEQLTKEQYERKLSELKLGSYDAVQEYKKICTDMMRDKAIHRDVVALNCENCSGNNLKNCKNTLFSFNASNCEDCKYLYDVLDAKDCQDLNYSLYQPELSYELVSTLNMVHSAFSMASHYNNEVYYCDLTNHSSNLFGCIGLDHKKYCILNKQYSQEEYEELVSKIIEDMKKRGEFGEFFPVELSPFAYNETVAHEYFPLSKEEVVEKGWRWSEGEEQSAYQGPKYEIPDNISDVSDDILRQVLICENSKRPFKIIQQELEFYRKMNVPIPRRSPNQRHLDRFEMRNPRKLWKRKCDKCGEGIETTYAPERPEAVYCEECYLKEVY